MPAWLVAVLITVVLAVFGGVFNLALEVGQINDKLDRNCRILATLDQDIRIVAVEQAAKTAAGLPLGRSGGSAYSFGQFPSDVSC